jgi:hypothetical protein
MAVRNARVLMTLYRTEGLRAVLKRLAFRFFHVHTFVVYRLRLSESLPVVQAPPGIEITEVTKTRLQELREGRADLPEYFYRDEAGTNGRCWVGLENGRLGFVFWFTYHAESGFVRLGTNEVELAYAYCLQELRGRHLTATTILLIARTLFAEGITAMLAVPHSETVAINKTFLACGFKKIGSIKRFGFFTWPHTPVDYSATPDPGDDAVGAQDPRGPDSVPR